MGARRRSSRVVPTWSPDDPRAPVTASDTNLADLQQPRREAPRSTSRAADLLNRLAATGANLLVRCKSGRRLPAVAHCGDGSFLSRLGALTVRVIDAEISIVTSQGDRTGHYRLLTTLADPSAHPAAELIRLYHERWGATRSRTRLSELPDRRIDLMATA